MGLESLIRHKQHDLSINVANMKKYIRSKPLLMLMFLLSIVILTLFSVSIVVVMG